MSTISRSLTVLRWLSVLPASLSSSVLTGVILTSLFSSIQLPPATLSIAEGVLLPLVCMYVFVWIGSKVTPAAKGECAMILWAAVLSSIAIAMLASQSLKIAGVPIFTSRVDIPNLMAITGASLALINVLRDSAQPDMSHERAQSGAPALR